MNSWCAERLRNFIQAGQEVWHTASLVASDLRNSPKIQATCADCHAHDGRDLKYFNVSNASISRSPATSAACRFPASVRPWNPPYQPVPGLDARPISHWAAGAGLAWILDRDTDALGN